MTRNNDRSHSAADGATLKALPNFLRDVAEATSISMALNLSHQLGGRTVYIPRRPRPDSVLAATMGARMAARLSHIAGGEKIEIPKFKGSRRLAIAMAEGSHNEVARRFGVTSRWVRQVRAELAARSTEARRGRRRCLPRRWTGS
jgi:hypothetical protein